MRRLPGEFEALLSRKGRSVLRGALRLGLGPKERFGAWDGLLDRAAARKVRDVLDRALRDVLRPMEDPIPEWTITGMQHDFSSRHSKAFQRAGDIGLHELLGSESYSAFAEALAGRRLARRFGTQVLCYGPGDDAGPHNDHHPEDPLARGGYTDVHLTFCTDGVLEQTLVAAKAGHFTEWHHVATVGGVTCYRLPFWHYVNPLQARRGREREARRWVVLGTFLDA